MKNKDINIFVQGAGLNFLGLLFGQLCAFGTQVILARELKPEKFGLFAIGFAIFQIGQSLLPFGLNRGIINFGIIYKEDQTKLINVIWNSFILSLISALAAIFISSLFSEWFAIFFFQNSELTEIIKKISFIFIFSVPLVVISSGTRILKKMHYGVLSENIIPKSLQIILVLILVVYLNQDIEGALNSIIIAYFVGFVFSVIFIYLEFPFLKELNILRVGSFWKPLLKYSFPITIAGIFSVWLKWVSNFELGYFGNTYEVGIYQSVSQTANILTLGLVAFSYVFAPMASDLFYKKEFINLSNLYRLVTKWALCFSIPLGLVFIVFPSDVLSLIYGGLYKEGAMALILLTFAQIINAGTGPVGVLLMMTNNGKVWALSTVFSFVLIIILNALLIPNFGLNGAAIATSLSTISLFLLGLGFLKYKLDIFPYNKSFKYPLLSTLFTFIILIIFKLLVINSISIWTLGIIFTLSITIFLIIIFLKLEKEERELINNLFLHYKLDKIWKK